MTRTSSFEIRGAAGGDEAALFAGDLLTMYQKYAEAQGWRFEVMEASYEWRWWFQRKWCHGFWSICLFETQVRIRCPPGTTGPLDRKPRSCPYLNSDRSVMPEVEEVEYDIDPKDLRVDIYHASGAGGQNVNKVATAVRIVHLPTNIKVEMQEERTQQKNREEGHENHPCACC